MTEVFGITGTNGKTTASCMLNNILRENGIKTAQIGTIEHKIGSRIYEAVNTTPGAMLLKEYFEEMAREDIKVCVMEISSHGIAQERIKNIPICYAAFTNLSQDHLDYHGDMEEYYQVKKRLFKKPSIKYSCINTDDDYGRRLYHELKNENLGDKNLMSYSTEDKKADVFGQIISESLKGTKLKVHVADGFLPDKSSGCLGEIHIKIPGRVFAQNGMAAVSLAMCGGIKFSAIARGLQATERVAGRFEICESKGKKAVVDYAHTPEALKNLLLTVRKLIPKGKIITVFGCGGNRDKGKRPVMGQYAGELSDLCILTEDNNRNEKVEDIIYDIEKGIINTQCPYYIIYDRYEAISSGVKVLNEGDVIVIAGKGHEVSTARGKDKIPFSDSCAVKELL